MQITSELDALMAALDSDQVGDLLDLDDGLGEVLADLLAAFADRARDQLTQMASLAAASDFEQLAQVAHSLKGASGNLGAQRVAQACRLLELAAGAQDKPRILALVNGLPLELQLATEALAAQTAQTPRNGDNAAA